MDEHIEDRLSRGNENYNYQLLGRKSQNRENLSLVKVNISRINSEGKNRIYIYHLLGRRPRRGENPSPVKVNISRIDSLGNKSRDYNYLFNG